MNKPNIPEEIDFYRKEYDMRRDWRVNGWMYVALTISFASELDQIKAMQPAWRGIIAIAPFPFILVWVRDLWRWIQGMDELHRRITQTAMIFAVSATLFVVTVGQVLLKAGIIWPPGFLEFFFDPTHVWMRLSLIMIFYLRSYRFFNRRYR